MNVSISDEAAFRAIVKESAREAFNEGMEQFREDVCGPERKASARIAEKVRWIELKIITASTATATLVYLLIKFVIK